MATLKENNRSTFINLRAEAMRNLQNARFQFKKREAEEELARKQFEHGKHRLCTLRTKDLVAEVWTMYTELESKKAERQKAEQAVRIAEEELRMISYFL